FGPGSGVPFSSGRGLRCQYDGGGRGSGCPNASLPSRQPRGPWPARVSRGAAGRRPVLQHRGEVLSPCLML
ncbi:hypothetical protein Nmel_015112, partial [Mimus melanotis]